MSKLKYRAFIEDAQNEKCTDQELEALFNIFEYVMKEQVSRLLCKASFDMADFPSAKAAGVDGFTLTVERYPYAGANQWTGIFEKSNGKKLKLLGTLEPD